MKNQPIPFEFKRGVLVDAVGVPVDFQNKDNLTLISDTFVYLKEAIESAIDSFASLKDQFKNRPRVVEAVDYELSSFIDNWRI